MFITLSKAKMASPTGLCQAFSDNADGYARGEGCGIIIIERLGDVRDRPFNLKGGRGYGCFCQKKCLPLTWADKIILKPLYA